MQYDSFELLYVYIKKIDRCFENQSFNFSNDYHVEYDNKNKKLKITKNDNNGLKDFFSSKIKSINLVVGKNGSGKTTLFDLLGLKKVDRYNLFNLNNNDEGWFALYKCNNDAEFYVEGFNPDLLFRNQELINEQLINPLYAIHFYYDFKMMTLCEKFFANSNTHINLPFLFYNKEITNSSLLLNPKLINSGEDPSYLINRKYIKNGNLADLYYLASNNYNFFKEIESKNLKILITFSKKMVKTVPIQFDIIFNDKFNHEEYDDLVIKDRYRYRLFKEVVYAGYELIENSEKQIKYIAEINNVNTNLMILEKINQMCAIACRYIKKYSYSFISYSYLDELCHNISQLPKYYLNYQHLQINEKEDDYLGIEIPLTETFNQNAYEILRLYELLSGRLNFDCLKQIFQVHLNHQISEGELGLINTYSGIYYALTNEYKNQKSAIILLDEPDKSFHPMWIASFIDNLIKLVESIDNEMTYQFIISTHSPFMLSDVPKEAITCIDIVDHHRIVSQAKTSFASNYYDIIKDIFFLKDSVGAFAKRKINEIIEEINNLNSNTNQETITKLNNLINIIDDPYLKNTLSLQLNKKIAKFNQKTALALEKQQLEARIKEITLLLGDEDD